MLTNVKLMDYEEYLRNANDEEMIFINELYDQGQILEEGLRDIISLNKHIKILVITSTRCKDSATILPFLIKLSQFNENIEVKFLLKNDNEELLSKLSGEMKVPTIMVIDNNNVIRKFVEFPKGVKDILINNPKEKTQEIIDEMRNGKYNDLIQLDLIKFITGKKYEYISFNRLDK
ncbi:MULTISPECIES: thioredoxin family protein [unclassified Clostridium]|uniref:thioredoxin family protein n=1 Tax=unclassified Clostridium TaxID=2614128 RepID=UPI001898733D|nr:MULTISPECIES: thioredoxin family protein [unclassified Clostridium]MBP3916830.1 thioredoxin family protein [Clostridium sp.]MEE0932424.1 thioredoxin family protein [Clostridium sp.]